MPSPFKSAEVNSLEVSLILLAADFVGTSIECPDTYILPIKSQSNFTGLSFSPSPLSSSIFTRRENLVFPRSDFSS